MTPRSGHDPQASFLHEYWKKRIADRFQQAGYRVELESPRQRGGGNLDISAKKHAKHVAVEIETSKSDVVANVKRDLLSGAQEVIVVATDEDAFSRIERQLAHAKLLIPGRVHVLLRDAHVSQLM